MNAKEIGEKLVALCREGKNLESIDTLYAKDVESVEAMAMPNGERVSRGVEAVRGKNLAWSEIHEVHEAKVEGPYPNGEDRFCVRFDFDVTRRPTGERMRMDEVGLFTVANGKIVREEFFYGA